MIQKVSGSIESTGANYTLVNGDFCELGQSLPHHHFDAVITDPPYMTDASSIGQATRKSRSWIDIMNAAYFYEKWMRIAWRSMKPDGFLIVFTNWRTFPVLCRACWLAEIPISSKMIWNKKWISTGHPNQLRNQYEEIIFCPKGAAKISNRSLGDVFDCKWQGSNTGITKHPAEKPLELMKFLVETVTKPKQIILDPFSGSGKTGVAALQLKRSFHGFEGDPKHFREASKILEGVENPLQELTQEENKLKL